MDALEKRPLGTFSSSFYIFACVFFSVGRTFRSASAILALVLLVLSVIYSGPLMRRQIGKGLTALFAGMLAASLFSGIAVDVIYRDIYDTSETSTHLDGTVIEVMGSTSYSGIYIFEDSDGSKYLLSCDNGELSAGDNISFDGVTSPLEADEGYKYQLFSEGIFLFVEADGSVEISGSSHSLSSILGSLRDKLSAVFTAEMSETSGGFSAALLLGDRSLVQDSTARDFICLGISHILSLSGTHLTVLFFLVSKLVPDRRRLRFLRFAVIALGIMFYSALTGFSASVIRSGIMFLIAAASDLINRKADSFTSLSAAVLLICVADPTAPFDMGLQLSYLSLAGLIISNELYKNSGSDAGMLKNFMRKLIPALVVPSAVLPLSWLRFGSVSLISPVANIIFVPLITFFIPILAILLMISPVKVIFTPLIRAVDTAISFILDAIEDFASSADFLMPLRGTVTDIAVVLFVILFLGAIIFCRRTRRILTGLAALVLSLTLLAAQFNIIPKKGSMTAYYACSGRDDAIVISSGGHTLLIDVGSGASAAKTAADLAVCYGGRVNSLMLTHLHHSHTATLGEIANNFYLDTLWLPLPYSAESQTVFDALRDMADSLGVTVKTYLCKEELKLGDCTVSVPEITLKGVSTHPDVRFAVSCSDGQLMYGEDFVTISDDTVLIYSTHGNPTSGGTAFGKALVSPKRATAFDSVEESVTVTDKALVRFDS